jgi:hypothetical protein
MNVYRFKNIGATWDVFSTSMPKARSYLMAITNITSKPVFLGKVTDFVNVGSAIAVQVPSDYLTPKQASKKLVREEYKRGDITYAEMISDLERIDKWA